MCHLPPATYLVWSTLSIMLGFFLIYHLWCFDRFKCLRWNQGTQGTFKRVMTYSYLFSVPMLIVYAVGFCIIKYSEGLIYIPEYGILPMPYQLWSPEHRSAIIPLYFCLSVCWSLEMVTHLEELCFWLFVVNAKPTQKDWFGSPYFKVWMAGSGFAILYMPLVTILTRSDPLKCEAYTFLAGGLGSLSLTLWFLPVLYFFRPFLGGLRREGVDMNTITRLTKFYELNRIRVVFRLFFAIPVLILSIDGLRPHHPLNSSSFGSEFLSILAGFGVIVSSGITLIIFFPRSIENEIVARDVGTRSRGFFQSLRSRNHLTFVSQEQELYGTYDPEDTPLDKQSVSNFSPDHKPAPLPLPPSGPLLRELPRPPLSHTPPMTPTEPIRLSPNRRQPSFDHQSLPTVRLSSNKGNRYSNPATKVSWLRQSFRSPIGAWPSRTLGASPQPLSADHNNGRSYLDLGGRSRW
ncbi:hypothetical protein BJV74DRAFT_887515 [Russula compacta]|nr:hypothetical protein BJV74DRAFT_887515 [Russula compacta]